MKVRVNVNNACRLQHQTHWISILTLLYKLSIVVNKLRVSVLIPGGKVNGLNVLQRIKSTPMLVSHCHTNGKDSLYVI